LTKRPWCGVEIVAQTDLPPLYSGQSPPTVDLFCERRLDWDKFVAVVLDGKTFAQDPMLIKASSEYQLRMGLTAGDFLQDYTSRAHHLTL